MKLVRIPAGKFTMGSPKDEKQRSDDEQQHEVEITKEFWLGVHEVTQKQFKDVMGYNPSYFSSDGEGKAGATYFDFSKPAGGKAKLTGKDTSDFPVENVSWEEADEFCKKLSAKIAERGRKYRLPTEAEWEYSCRGGATSYRVFHFGNALSSTQANFDGNYPYGGAAKGPYLERTCKVGSYPANGFGLYDMHGNVWEWCQDRYDEKYYTKSPRQDPQGPERASDRVIRGGGWFNIGQGCRSAIRYGDEPANRDLNLGFRVAIGAPASVTGVATGRGTEFRRWPRVRPVRFQQENQMKVVNLTPHAIVLRSASGEDTTIPASGQVARVASTPGAVGPVDGLPVPVARPTVYGDVEGLPAPEAGTIYVVSALVLGRTNRPDVFAPGTGPQDGAVRNEKGHITAVTRLIAAV
jgi:formylglycine-generating enzyme required for sulfatase activity